MITPAENLGEGRGRRGKPKHSSIPELFPTSTPTASTAPVSDKFVGTDNPRYLRALHAMLKRSQTREHLDRAAGCSNGPDLVADLRRRGLEVPCQRIPAFDRDGKEVRVGVYSLTDADRRKIHAWLSRRQKGHSEVAVVATVFGACLALAWLAETIVRWLP